MRTDKQLIGIILATVIAAAGSAYAQGGRNLDRLEDLTSTVQDKAATNIAQPPGVALESVVDPGKYFVGPSDIIAVNIWMTPPLNLSLTVTPEGTLIIPTVGEVRVADLTLAEAKARVLEEIRKRFRKTEASMTLVRPRPIVVTVVGTVLNPGLYTLTAVDRANKAIEEANKGSRTQTQDDVASILTTMSTRNIVLRHKDAIQERVDVTKFLATKQDRWNPYLREGDVVIVPRKDQDKNVFGIYGEVNAPGRYEFVEGDSVLDAFQIGQGFTRLALKDSVVFSRLNEEGTKMSNRIINLEAILDRSAPNKELEPGDRLVVKPRLDLRQDYRVMVRGEVLYPGAYPITRNRTRLSDVIKQAGGFTEFGALKSAELLRRSVRREDIQLERLESLRGGVSVEDSTYYIVETNLRIQKEIVNVDFDQLFVKHDSTQDVILQDDDIIVVPSIRKTIYVFGQVTTPGHVPYVTGEPAEYYLQKAGGLTERARSGDIKIVKAKTRQWLSPDETTIEEGDYVWVPKEVDRPFGYYMMVMSQAASVLSVVIGVAVVVLQFRK